MAERKCRIDRIITNVDMRRRTSMWEVTGILNQLRPGRGILMLNSANTICRLVDSQYGIHDWYADPGFEFDEADIIDQVNQRILEIGVGVFTGRKTTTGRAAGLSTPEERAA